MAIKWIALLLFLGGVVSAEAQVINAASCSQADVQTAFNSISASTTTVNIPACSGGVGWSNQVSLTVPSGSTTLSILGAGSLSSQGGGDATVIIDNYASSNAILIISTAGQSSFLRLAGITFQGGSGAAKWNGIVNIQGLSQNVRVDHSHFNTQTYSPSVASSSLQFNGCLYGVTDHSIFDNPAGSVNNSFRAYNAGSCNNDALGVGDQSWAAPTGLGSANFMFAENNTFNNGAGNDCTQGGRYVWRYNTMNMTSPAPAVQTHPTGGAGRIRGCRAWEIYNNTATAQSSNYINAFFWVSSGTGVVWGNTLPSSATGGGTGYRSLINANVMRATNQPTRKQRLRMDGDIAARLRLGECQGQVIGMKIFRGKTGTHVLTKLGEDKAICWLEVLVQTAAARTTSRIALRVATRHRAARGPDKH